MNTYRKALLLPAAIFLALLLHACASIGNPSGGPRDERPPRFRGADPAPGATGVSPQKVVLEFDELINVKDAFTAVVVSPTSEQTAKVSTQGRRIIVQMPDSLAPNTTYTIDFGNSIEDINEANKLGGFTYSFSTGPTLDTLRIAGMVLGARDLEPQQQTIVGVHSLTEDSVFRTMRLERVAKTDDRGRFIIRGLAPGRYRVFALGDLNNDYRWDNPEEAIGFHDVMVSPTAERVVVTDTVYNLLTAQPDTVVSRERTRFLPNDLLIPFFNIDYKPQYVVDYQRVDSTQIRVILNARTPRPAALALTGPPGYDRWYRMERSAGNDTLTYWIEPRDIVKTDTLRLALTYQALDAVGGMEVRRDTLQFVTPRPRAVKKEKKKKDTDTVAAPPTPHIELRLSASGSQEVDAPLYMEFSTPLDTLFASRFHLEQKVDTLWKPLDMPLPVLADSLTLRRYRMDYPWEYGTTYRLTVDTLAAVGLYGLTPKPLKQELRVRPEEDYGHLRLLVTGVPDSVAAVAELLNSSDTPVRAVAVEGGSAIFTNLQPGTYYARLFLDRNGNGVYDTGSYHLWEQPEPTYYYPKKINLKKNWEITQSWDINAVAVDAQKPEAIKKNKPEQTKRGRKKQTAGEEEEEEEEFDVTRNPFDPSSR